jgi:hypothetical protein
MQKGMGPIIVRILTMPPVPVVEGWNDVLREACHVLKGLTVHDDIRRDMSCAHDNGRYFLNAQVNYLRTHY